MSDTRIDENDIKESILQGLKRAIAENKTADFADTLKSVFADFETQIQKAKADKKNILEAIAKEYPEKKAALSSIYKTLPNPHIKTWEEYEQSVITFDESKDYKSGIFGRRFPMGTISYIGARPARGKTTMLVNTALDAIRQGKNAVYITAEETTKQILTRFILCKSYELNVKEAGSEYGRQQVKNKMTAESNTRTAFYEYMRNKATILDGLEATNADRYESATNEIKGFLQSGKLTVFEAYGATYSELKNFLTMQEAGSVILIDYIQHLKAPERLVTQTRQIQIQEVSHTLADIAGQSGLIMISGAQFTRPNDKAARDTTKKRADTFDENSFREAGDIEQDGHILIGVGKDPKTDTFYYSCMKDREAPPDNGTLWQLEKNLSYSYMRARIDDKGERIEYHISGKDTDNGGALPIAESGAGTGQYGKADKSVQYRIDHTSASNFSNFSYGNGKGAK